MDLEQKIAELDALYRAYQREAAQRLEQAACERGCADCCTDVGMVGATSLEAWIVHAHLEALPPSERQALERALETNRRERLADRRARCAFLNDVDECRVYAFRPFGCRRLYSVRRCEPGGPGPAMHRQVFAIGQRIEARIRTLDRGGVSGHLSFVLHLFSRKSLRQAFLRGELAEAVPSADLRWFDLVVNR